MRRINHSSRFIEECYSRYPKLKLGGHISVIRGVSYKPSDVRSSVDEGVAIILRSNNIADGEINFDDLVYVVQERVQNEQKLKPGDIVMCSSNGSKSLVGKAGLLKDNIPNAAFGAFCLGIKCKETILPEYLNTYFNTQVYRNEIESMGNGTNIINIRPDNITNLSIPVPPVEKQKAFVEVVNQADKSKFSDFKSRFISQFGNIAQVTVKEVADEVFAGGDKPDDMSELKNNEYRYPVFSNGIGNNAELGFSRECRVHKQAITVSARGTIGYAEIRDGGFTPVVRLLTLIPKAKYSLPFLKYALNQITYRTSGSSIGQLPVPDFIKLTVPDADLNEQKEFESLYHQADKSKYLN